MGEIPGLVIEEVEMKGSSCPLENYIKQGLPKRTALSQMLNAEGKHGKPGKESGK